MTVAWGAPPPSKAVPAILQLMVSNLKAHLMSRQYLLALGLATNIIDLSRKTPLDPGVVAVAEKAVYILNRHGFSTEALAQQTQKVLHETPCPEDSEMVDPRTGQCRDGFVPFFAEGKRKTRCCVRMKNQLKQIGRDTSKVYRAMDAYTNTAPLKAEFAARFAVPGTEAGDYNMRKLTQMATTGKLTKRINGLLKREADAEVLDLVNKLERAPSQGPKLLGVSEKLYAFLQSMFNTPYKLVKWFVHNDWSRLWMILWLMRSITFFACAFFRLKNYMNVIYALSYSVGYVATGAVALAAQSYIPIILSYAIFQSIGSSLAMGVKGLFMNTIGQNLLAVFRSVQTSSLARWTVGLYSLLGIHTRLTTLWNLPGLITDIVLFVSDVYNFVSTVVNNITTAGSGAFGMALDNYCGGQIRAYAAGTLNIVKSLMFIFLRMLCQKILGPVVHVVENVANKLSGNTQNVSVCKTMFAQITALLGVSTATESVDQFFKFDASPNQLFNIVDPALANVQGKAPTPAAGPSEP